MICGVRSSGFVYRSYLILFQHSHRRVVLSQAALLVVAVLTLRLKSGA